MGWPAHLPLRVQVRPLPVGFREHDLNSPVLWQMFTGRKGKNYIGVTKTPHGTVIRIHPIAGFIFQLKLKHQINENVLMS